LAGKLKETGQIAHHEGLARQGQVINHHPTAKNKNNSHLLLQQLQQQARDFQSINQSINQSVNR